MSLSMTSYEILADVQELLQLCSAYSCEWNIVFLFLLEWFRVSGCVHRTILDRSPSTHSILLRIWTILFLKYGTICVRGWWWRAKCFHANIPDVQGSDNVMPVNKLPYPHVTIDLVTRQMGMKHFFFQISFEHLLNKDFSSLPVLIRHRDVYYFANSDSNAFS